MVESADMSPRVGEKTKHVPTALRHAVARSGHDWRQMRPLAFAIQWPDAPLSQPILWLIRIAGPDASVPVYSLTMLVLILIVYTGHTLFDYLTKHPRRRGG